MNEPKLAVIMHVHHLDVFEELFFYLENMPYCFDLHINFSEIINTNQAYITEYCSRLKDLNPSMNIYFTTSFNRGQDLGGFFASTANAKKLGLSYDYVCKIHTKANGQNLNLDFMATKTQWRRELMTTLLGSRKRIVEILNAFVAHPNIGLISNGKYYSDNFLPGQNKANYNFFVEKLGLNKEHCWPNNPFFLAGTMFWMRGKIWDFLMEQDISINDFETGTGQDGLRSHAFERIFDATVKHLGYICGMVEE